MALESIRGYVQLASGMGELTRARAMEAARGLLSLPGGQVTAVADELRIPKRRAYDAVLAARPARPPG